MQGTYSPWSAPRKLYHTKYLSIILCIFNYCVFIFQCSTLVKSLISVPELIVNKSEENLRHKYDVQIKTIPKDASAVYDKRQIKKNSVTICLFIYDEYLKDILTMFEVNYI